MSIPITTAETQFGRLGWAIRLSPLLVAIILAALWIAGAPPRVPDLRLSAPVVARPGATIGLRAWQVAQDEDGYTVIRAPEVIVELRSATGLTLVSTELQESLVQGREGYLQIPDGGDDVLSIHALAQVDGREVTVDRTLHVRRAIESGLPEGRAVNAFQAYELGPLRRNHPKRALRWLDPRIEEGACVPELPCWLSVWVGPEASRVRLRPLAGLRDAPSPVQPSKGFARFPLQVVGSEARIEVQALDEMGLVLASREARLPLVPGGLVLRASVEDGRARLDWEQLGDRGPVLLDVFEGRRWARALSLSPADPYLPDLGPGVWRLQARTDLFSDNTAGVAYLVLAHPGGAGRLREAADTVLAEADRDGLDPLAFAILDDTLDGAPEDEVLRALFAVPSFDVVSVGAGLSSRIGVDERRAAEQERLRWLAAAAILLIGLIVSMVLLRVELVAQARARRLLEDLSGEPLPASSRSPSGRGIWAFVLLVFVLMAVLALSKRWF